MRRLNKLSVALFTVALIAASTHSNAQVVDCRSCHAPIGAPGAADFSGIYANPLLHHRVGIEYPAGNQSFRMPNGLSVDGSFFDKNGDGLPDIDEIQLFDSTFMNMIECATCHMEHGYAPPVPHPPSYLRFKNTGSSLCTTCHIM